LVSTETIGHNSGDGILSSGDQKKIVQACGGSVSWITIVVVPTAELAAVEMASAEVGSASPPAK
jgi:hypothetical protein